MAPQTLKQIRDKNKAAQKAWRDKQRDDPQFIAKEKQRQKEWRESLKGSPEKLEHDRKRKREWYRKNKKTS